MMKCRRRYQQPVTDVVVVRHEGVLLLAGRYAVSLPVSPDTGRTDCRTLCI